MQLKLQGSSVGSRLGRLEDAVKHVGPRPISSSVWLAVASVIGQQGVRHQVY